MPASFLWTAEEARYLKAVLRWEDDAPSDSEADIATAEKGADSQLQQQQQNQTQNEQQQQQTPESEFRILVVGAKGVGKSSILSQFAQGGTAAASNSSKPTTTSSCRRPLTVDGRTHTIDALEMPSDHLHTGGNDDNDDDPMLAHALAITEAAILVYDVRDPPSLQRALAIAALVRDTVMPTREYALVLVGNKRDHYHCQNPTTVPPDVPAEPRPPLSYSQGARAASTIIYPPHSVLATCPFLETSTRIVPSSPDPNDPNDDDDDDDDNDDNDKSRPSRHSTQDNPAEQVFHRAAREIIKIRKANQIRREQAEERLATLRLHALHGSTDGGRAEKPGNKLTKTRTLTKAPKSTTNRKKEEKKEKKKNKKRDHGGDGEESKEEGMPLQTAAIMDGEWPLVSTAIKAASPTPPGMDNNHNYNSNNSGNQKRKPSGGGGGGKEGGGLWKTLTMPFIKRRRDESAQPQDRTT